MLSQLENGTYSGHLSDNIKPLTNFTREMVLNLPLSLYVIEH